MNSAKFIRRLLSGDKGDFENEEGRSLKLIYSALRAWSEDGVKPHPYQVAQFISDEPAVRLIVTLFLEDKLKEVKML